MSCSFGTTPIVSIVYYQITGKKKTVCLTVWRLGSPHKWWLEQMLHELEQIFFGRVYIFCICVLPLLSDVYAGYGS